MFEFIGVFFNAVLYDPLLNFLVLIYNYVPGKDFGIAVIILTIAIRLILWPVSVKAVRSQKSLSALQPHVQELQKKHKDDKEKQAKEMMELYRRAGVNPFSGLFLTLVQLPILIALYQVFWNGLKPEALSHLYSFVANPQHINTIFLGFLDVSGPNAILAVIAGIVQFFQTKMLLPPLDPSKTKTHDISSIMQKQMVYFFPILTIVILLRLPSALGLYWITTGIFSIIQQYFIIKTQDQEKAQ